MLRHPLLLALALLAAGTAPASAQEVRGTALDDARGAPLPGARLLLVDREQSTVVDSTRADRSGRYRLAARRAGMYVLVFQMDGYASVTSGNVRLEQGATTDFDFRVTLAGNSALLQMGDVIRMNEQLQGSLPEICGEPFRAWEAGLLVGVVRSRAARTPVRGARVSIAAGDGIARSTVSNENGVYVLCNVPVGPAVPITISLADGTVERTDAEIRTGTASWYDLPVGPRRR